MWKVILNFTNYKLLKCKTMKTYEFISFAILFKSVAVNCFGIVIAVALVVAGAVVGIFFQFLHPRPEFSG